VIEEKFPTAEPRTGPESPRPPGTFVGECIRPSGTEFALPATVGEPAVPLRFTWQRRDFEVRAVRRRWKGYEPDRTHGSGQRYLRRHWYELGMTDETFWTVYR